MPSIVNDNPPYTSSSLLKHALSTIATSVLFRVTVLHLNDDFRKVKFEILYIRFKI